MSIHFLSLFMLSALTACGSKDDDTADAEAGSAVTPQEGRWAVSDGSWSDDQCNAPMTMVAPTSLEISDAVSGSFMMDLIYDGQSIIDAPVECSLQGGEYTCSEATANWSVPDMDVNISLTGVSNLTFTSDSTMSGSSDMEMTCTGSDCEEAGEFYNISSPCTTTYNLMGTYTPE
jgi:hypothetical protein